MHMGINGQRLDKAQMSSQGYILATTEFHIIVEIPIGSPDGYYKVGGSLGCVCRRLHKLKLHNLQSHAPDYQYHITYTVEPMLEVLWTADNGREDTRYKVLFPITTPMMARPPHHEDSKA